MKMVKALVLGAAGTFGLMATLMVVGRDRIGQIDILSSYRGPNNSELKSRLAPDGQRHLLPLESSTRQDPVYLQARAQYRSAFDGEKYQEAVSMIEALLSQYPNDAGLVKDLSVALYAAAVKAFESYEYENALVWLRRSLALGYEPARKALAQVLVNRGQAGEAIEILRSTLTAGDDAMTLESLIDLSLTRGNRAEAAEFMERYEALLDSSTQESKDPLVNDRKESDGPNGFAKASQAFFESRRKRIEAGQALSTSGLFVSRDEVRVRYSMESLERLAETVLAAAHQTIDTLKLKFGPLTAGAEFDVELVPQDAFGELTGAPIWAGALFDGTIRIPFPSQQGAIKEASEQERIRIEQMTIHETTHAYLYNLCGDRVPSWLGEGLAQMQEGRNAAVAESALFNLHGPTWTELKDNEILDLPFSVVRDSNIARSLYLRSLLLSAKLEDMEGRDVWRRLLASMCTLSQPLPEVLEANFGERSASSLWHRYLSAKP